MTISLLAMWQTERWGEPPPADLAACARQRIAELERAIQTMQPPALAGYAMEFTPGDSLESRISALVRLQEGWREALGAQPIAHSAGDDMITAPPAPCLPHPPSQQGAGRLDSGDGAVRYTCWACDAELGVDEVCTRCCGAEAIPGRCALPAGHRGPHQAPSMASPARSS